MKKLFIFTMMCLFGLFSLQVQAQTEQDPVRWVKAVAEESSVDVSWSVVPSTTDYEDFETGGLATRDWDNTSEYPWVITENAYEGGFAMKATGERIDKAVSAIELDYELKDAGFVAFYHRVSSEANYDKGNFYIDGKLMSTISGNKEWGYIEFFISAGKHTYRWEYAKDSLTNTGSDSYYVDNISFYKPVTPFEGGWITYDDDKYTTSIGTGSPSPVYWGISFPMTASYKDLTLSKVAVLDTEAGGMATFTANIYLGGTDAPEELVSTQDFQVTGSGEMMEIELETPVVLDGTRPLWITFYCDQLSYPVGVCASVGNPNSDWLSLDGIDWVHAYEYGFESSCMVRGYLEDANGRLRVLASNNTKPFFEGGVSTGEFVEVPNATPRYLGSMVRATNATPTYNIYKKNILTGNSQLIAENVTDTVYTDNTWATTEVGAYQYGVAAVYSTATATAWSNIVDQDMFTKVVVNVETDTEEPVAGTKVTFVNLIEEEYSYSAILGMEGTYTFENFRKGSYEVTISKKGYVSEYDSKAMEVWNETTIDCELKEDLSGVKDLYVSPTGWVMWDGTYVGSGDEFYADFEDCSLNGWVTIDADNDNYTWLNSIEIAPPGSGHNESVAFATSFSCLPNGTYDPLTPDNYLVTDKRYNIGKFSQLRFWVSAQDAYYPAEHYGVAISLESNTTAEGFTTIWEETLSAKSGSKGVRGTTYQGAWYEKVIDLSAYAGQSVYIAIRHFNCTDQFFIGVDDISLENNIDRALTKYKVYLNDELVADDLQTPFYQHENLVEGQEYTTKVIPVYTMGEGATETYTWKYLGCGNYEGVKNFEAEYKNSGTVVTWTMPETESSGKSRSGEWLTYDDGTNVEKIGLTYDGTNFELFKWGVMFPASDVASYAGKYITKLSIYDCDEFDGECFVYEGGNTEPETLLHSQSFSCTGSNEYRDIVLTESVELSGNKNVWVVFSNKNGKSPAAVCADQNDPNSRWIYYEGYGWLDNAMVSVPAYTWQIKAFVTDDAEDVFTIPDAEALGVMLYRNGKIVERLAQGQEYIDKKAVEGDEYSIRVVYGGEKDLTYYAMSCMQTTEVVFKMECSAPAELSAKPMAYDDGRFGALVGWPLPDKSAKWFQYDNGNFYDAIGGLDQFYWGVMFPFSMQEDYIGANLTKISFYDHVAQDGTIHIFYGGSASPETLIHTQPFSTSGVEDFIEIDLTSPLPITGDNLWVVIGTISGMSYPAAMSEDVGEANGRWVSLDGETWEDGLGMGLDGTWMIRAFVKYGAKGATLPLEPMEFVSTATGNGTLLSDPSPVRASTLKNYNIYRGTSLDNMEIVATTTEKTYFDEIEKGTYYYQVTAVYEENGETCESAFATAYQDNTVDYVIVEVTAIDENGVKGMVVYPNPTEGNLNITAENMKRITIANSLGQIVYDRVASNDNEIIDMSQYKAGVYMVRIMTENGVAVKRISVL